MKYFIFFKEMVNMVKPDERAVMTYVSCYYHALKGAQKVRSLIQVFSEQNMLPLLLLHYDYY